MVPAIAVWGVVLAGDKQLARLPLPGTANDMVDHVLHGADGVSKALEEIARKMGGGEVAVGFMEGATYPDGTPVAAVAFWNEYGGPGRQPRPFFRLSACQNLT